MTDKIRWGILGTGKMAHDFAADMVHAPNAELVAVGSRRQESAQTFSDTFDVPHAHGSYEALAADPDVDIAYIATPHNKHFRDAMMCMEAGKHCLVEKAFTLNAPQARKLIATARDKNLFLMEAMWTRFFPAFDYLRELLAKETIGTIEMVRSDLSHRASMGPESRHFDPLQAGGALLDIGIYPISFASHILGKPDVWTGVSYIGEKGVDYNSSCLLGYASGPMAVLSFSKRADAPREALIAGSKGTIRVLGRWQQPRQIGLSFGKNGEETIKSFEFEGGGYQFEAIAVSDAIIAGKTEHELMPMDETLWLMEIMDGLRQQWGLVYPDEQ